MPRIPDLDKGERKIAMCDCGRQIIFARTEGGKVAPYDATPDERGRNYFRGEVVHAMKKGEDPPAGAPRFTSHWATCPNAKAWRERQASHKGGRYR